MQYWESQMRSDTACYSPGAHSWVALPAVVPYLLVLHAGLFDILVEYVMSAEQDIATELKDDFSATTHREVQLCSQIWVDFGNPASQGSACPSKPLKTLVRHVIFL
jgi:hypothetical protein